MEQTSKEVMPGIYVVEYPPMANMTMERIVVSNPAIIEILKVIQLTKEEQEEAVDALVSRTADWMDLESEDQIAKIKSVLTMESVVEYLRSIETIRPQVDFVENGVDEEGSVVVTAYYTNLNREQRRLVNATMSDEQKQKMKDDVGQLDVLMQQGSIIDLAKAKLEKMAKAKVN